MPYYDIVNLPVIVKQQCHTKMNIIDQMACGYGTVRTTAVRKLQQVQSWQQTLHQSLSGSGSLPWTCAEASAAPKFKYSISQIL